MLHPLRVLIAFLMCLCVSRTGLASDHEISSKVGAEVAAALAKSPRVTVVVMLNAPTQASSMGLDQFRSSIAQSVDQTLAALPDNSYVLRRRFENLSAVTLDISSEALPALV